MNSRQIEMWALRVIDAVERAHSHEDSRAELKSAWPHDLPRVARQIAGHANAAGDEPVLWLIGVDEERGVVDFGPVEFSDWYSRLAAQFDALPPRITPLVVPYNDKRPVALLIETDRAPFVVKNPAHNTPGGGPVQWETPWRDGTSIRSARRADLLRLLTPLQRRPDIEVVEGYGSAAVPSDNGSPGVPMGLAYWVTIRLYLTPRGDQPLVIPFHRCAGWFTLPGHMHVFPVDAVKLEPLGGPSVFAEGTDYQVMLYGPAMLDCTMSAVHGDRAAWHNFSDLQVGLTLYALDQEETISIEMDFLRGDRGPIPQGTGRAELAAYSAIYAMRPASKGIIPSAPTTVGASRRE
jgi:hypothetical protein